MKNNKNVSTDEHECCPARSVLWYIVFLGFATNYMFRINFNLAVVSMVNIRPSSNVSLTSECIPEVIRFGKYGNTTVPSENGTLIDASILKSQPYRSPTFDWDETQQGFLLGSFYWLHWTTQLPGGMLASRYGTKLVFGLSNFLGVALGFLLPYAANKGFGYILTIRIIQGALSGFCWPAMHDMTAKWIPPNERSKFVTSYLGSSVGAATTYMTCGFMISLWGWESVFYVSGIIGTVWYISWLVLVYDSPAQHPRISLSEREYINKSLGQSVTKAKKEIPWKKIILSVPFWINTLAHAGGIWGMYILLTNGPTYFKFIHGWNIKATGLLSGIPQLLRMFFAFGVSKVGDYLLTHNKMNRTNVRKLATGIATIGQGFFMLLLVFSGCNHTVAFIFLAASTAVHGATTTGSLASFVDISPNHASVLLGLANSFSTLSGCISPTIIGYLTYANQTIGQWQKVFWIAIAILMGTGTLYGIFASSELQEWNDTMDLENESELVMLKDKKNAESNEKTEMVIQNSLL